MPGRRHFSPLPRPQWSGSLSGAWTPDMNGAGMFLGTLAGDVTIANPINIPAPGAEMILYVAQDATGGRRITWGSQYAAPAGLPLPQPNPRALTASTFRWRNTSAGSTPAWVLMGGDFQIRENFTLGTNIAAVGGYDFPGAAIERGSRVVLAGAIQTSAAIAQWAQVLSLATIEPHVIRGVDVGSGIALAFETDGTVLVAAPAGGIASGQIVYLDGKGYLL